MLDSIRIICRADNGRAVAVEMTLSIEAAALLTDILETADKIGTFLPGERALAKNLHPRLKTAVKSAWKIRHQPGV